MFDWLKKLFGRKKNKDHGEEAFEYGSWEDIGIRRQDVDITRPEERIKYVRALLDQIADVSGTLTQLNQEYGRTTAYLKDVDEIENLPEEESAQLGGYAMKVIHLEKVNQDYPKRERKISEEEYQQMEMVEPEADAVLAKLRENEEYRELVKRDLHRLHAEKQAYDFRKRELENAMANVKGMSLVCVCAMGFCFLLLLVMQFAMHMDASVGYILTGLAMAGTLVYVYVRYHDAAAEYKRVTAAINKLILLQNRVKIRYVNNTNLLDYLYTKYHTQSSKMLEDQLERFREEREVRKQFERTEEELSYYRKEMVKMLRRYQLFDPMVFLHDPAAVIDSRERVELRHGYNEQRQKLRAQIENNQAFADRAKKEIRDIAAEYPEYTREILAMVEEYENA